MSTFFQLLESMQVDTAIPVEKPVGVGEPQMEPTATFENGVYHNVICSDGVRRDAHYGGQHDNWQVRFGNIIVFGTFSHLTASDLQFFEFNTDHIPNLLSQCHYCNKLYLEHEEGVNARICWICRKHVRQQVARAEGYVSIVADYLEDYENNVSVEKLLEMINDANGTMTQFGRLLRDRNLDSRFHEMFERIEQIIRKLGTTELASRLYRVALDMAYFFGHKSHNFSKVLNPRFPQSPFMT